MSQIAQLSEAEIEERFYVTGRTAIPFTLAGYAEHKESFSVQFAGGSEHFLTILLAVQPENGCLIIDCSGSPEINRRFPESQRNVFLARPGGIHVQFTSGPGPRNHFPGCSSLRRALAKVHRSLAAARILSHRDAACSPPAVSRPAAGRPIDDPTGI